MSDISWRKTDTAVSPSAAFAPQGGALFAQLLAPTLQTKEAVDFLTYHIHNELGKLEIIQGSGYYFR